MPFPDGWDASSGGGMPMNVSPKSARVFLEGTTTDTYADTAFAFLEQTGADPYGRSASDSPDQALVVETIKITNLDGSNDLLWSFDGVNDHGRLAPGEVGEYSRREAGIALKAESALTADYQVEAW